jgi:hypothetical protein
MPMLVTGALLAATPVPVLSAIIVDWARRPVASILFFVLGGLGWTMMCCLLLFVSPTHLMMLFRPAQ